MQWNSKLVTAAAGIMMMCATLATSATAQDWKAEWDKAVSDAKGSDLNLVVEGEPAYWRIIEDFKKDYPDITVTVTSAHPSAFMPRMITEQQNGLFGWDVWWSPAANMTFGALPANALEPVPDYLILPEVKDESNWRNPKYIYTSDKGPYVFVHTHYLANYGLYNKDLVPGGELKSVDDLLNPALKGKIALRAPTRPHGGTMMLAAAMKTSGSAFVEKLLTEMDPVIVDNARQASDGVIRGDYAVAIGTDSVVLAECQQAGGCKNIVYVPWNFMHSRGISIPKNPPHAAAAKVFVNWLLSKKGQETYVKEWAQDTHDAASSMRKDVEPAPSQLDSVPDFSNLDQYVAVSLDSGKAVMDQVMKMFDASRK